jgi:hypothetical protein
MCAEVEMPTKDELIARFIELYVPEDKERARDTLENIITLLEMEAKTSEHALICRGDKQ